VEGVRQRQTKENFRGCAKRLQDPTTAEGRYYGSVFFRQRRQKRWWKWRKHFELSPTRL